MACFKKDGKGNYVRDEVKSTTPNLHGNAKAYLKANKADKAVADTATAEQAVKTPVKKPITGKGE